MNNSKVTLPEDFNWESYLDLNDDVKKCYPTKDGAIQHYINDGIRQKRLYKTQYLPQGFEWEVYLALNPDVHNVCKNKFNSIMHYEKHGHLENRRYKLDQVNIPNDFNWLYYLHNNPCLKEKILTRIDGIKHYYKTGIKEGLSFKMPENAVPFDFDWELYNKLNKLEILSLNEQSAKDHYITVGKKQNNIYKIPEGAIPSDFNWVCYVELNTDVKQIFNTKSLATYHYYYTGKNEGRIYKFNYTPSDFDCKLYLEMNPTITDQYKINDYTIKLHYDLFGYPQKLPYKCDYKNIPIDFDWVKYIEYNQDIKPHCKNESQSKIHYNNFGIYQNRQYKHQNQIINKNKYSDYPFLFHKYILNIVPEISNIKYTINSKFSFKPKNTLIAHLHCYNIDKFNEFFGEYINKIITYCSTIIITYSVGTITNLSACDFIYIKCLNQGMDIGGKMVCMDFLNSNNVVFDSILFLHSKTDTYMRKLYWEPLINNLEKIHKSIRKDKTIGIYVPPLIYMGDYATIIYKDHFVNPANVTCKWNFGNSLYMNDIDKYFHYDSKNFIFPEGNCFVCNSQIANALYGNKLLYNLLNSKTTLDITWIKSLYGGRGFHTGNTIQEIYSFFRNYNQEPKLHPNNIAWGAGHEGHADNMYEHSFERIVFKVVQQLKFKIKIMPFQNDPAYIAKLQQYNDTVNKLLHPW